MLVGDDVIEEPVDLATAEPPQLGFLRVTETIQTDLNRMGLAADHPRLRAARVSRARDPSLHRPVSEIPLQLKDRACSQALGEGSRTGGIAASKPWRPLLLPM